MGTLEGFASPFGPPHPTPPRSLPPSGTSGPAPSPPHPLATLAPSRSASPYLPTMVRHAQRWRSRRAPHATFLVATFVICGLTATARAEDERPGVFTYAYQGLVVGGGTGLAAGYLVAREGGLHSSDWKPMVYGVGIGALVGSGIGLTLGIIDVTRDKPGRAHYVLRDMAYGVGFGATVGAIAGGLAAISTKKAEHILFGASIGMLSGAVLGCVVGFLEGGHARGHSELDTDNQRFALSVMPVVAADGKLAYLPALFARY